MELSLAQVQLQLRLFGTGEAAGNSPLYEHLATKAAADVEVAGLLVSVPVMGTDSSSTSSSTTQAALLFAVAHRLIQADPLHPLAEYYPSLGGTSGVDADTWPLFREFLLGRASKVRELLETRHLQTNEVSRAAVLFPALARVTKEAGGKIAFLEVGCSAGLLLGLDQFGYRYQSPGGERIVAGPAKAVVGVSCAIELAEGAVFPKLPKKLAIADRVGLDLNPINAADEDELAWLEACVWADQPDRIRLLRTAAAAQRKNPPKLIQGDAVSDLAVTAELLPAELPLVILTSRLLGELTEARRAEFGDAVASLAAKRPVWWVSEEPSAAEFLPGREELPGGTGSGVLSVTHWLSDERKVDLLARTAVHGQRMTWLAAS